MEITRQLNRNFIPADGFQLLARQGNSIPLMRYQAQAERLYRRAVGNSSASGSCGQSCQTNPFGP